MIENKNKPLQTTVRLPERTDDYLNLLCALEGRSRNNMICHLIDSHHMDLDLDDPRVQHPAVREFYEKWGQRPEEEQK